MAKFTVSFKDQDAVELAIRSIAEREGLTWEELRKIDAIVRKFFEYGEYAHIELDTVKGTAKVLTVKP